MTAIEVHWDSYWHSLRPWINLNWSWLSCQLRLIEPSIRKCCTKPLGAPRAPRANPKKCGNDWRKRIFWIFILFYSYFPLQYFLTAKTKIAWKNKWWRPWHSVREPPIPTYSDPFQLTPTTLHTPWPSQRMQTLAPPPQWEPSLMPHPHCPHPKFHPTLRPPTLRTWET